MQVEYKPPRRYKKYVVSIISFLRKEFNLQDYEIIVKFVKEIDANTSGMSNADIAADIDPNSRYYFATIRLADRTYQDYKKKYYDDVFDTLVHEMIHIVLEPIVKIAEKATSPANEDAHDEVVEQVTQKLANIIRVKYGKKYYLPKTKLTSHKKKEKPKHVRK